MAPPISATGTVALTATPPDPSATSPPAQAVYLPVAVNRFAAPWRAARVWGAQFELEFIPERHAENAVFELGRARAAGLSSVRSNVRWDEVEPIDVDPSAFDWSASDSRLRAYAESGFDTIVTLVAYPDWATEFPCGGRLLDGREPDWREFVRAAAERYSRPPYDVALWEIGNEVDGDTKVRDEDRARPPGWGKDEPTTPYGGCWGDRAPAYVAFLKAAYEEIKAVDPSVRVTYGGLAYQDWQESFHMDFVDRFLAAGGGAYTDVVNYHWFAHLSRVPGQPSGPDKHRDLMARFARGGLTGRPVWMSETYQLTYVSDPESARAQVGFLTRELVEMLAFPEIERVYWYGFVDNPADIGDGNQIGRGLIWPDRSPKPAFQILPFTIAYTNGVPTDISTRTVTAFRFDGGRAGVDHVIAWSRSGEATSLTLEAPPNASLRRTEFPVESVMRWECCDTRLVDVGSSPPQVEVGAEPVFVELGGSGRP
jgi:hypothetical protein